MDTRYVIVGKIGSTYGVKGWVKILSYTEMTHNILQYPFWYLGNNGNWASIEVEAGHEHGKGVIVKLKGYDNPEKARLLAGKNIAVLRSDLPPLKKDEYYWNDLKGLTVINRDGETLGKVIYLIATGANDVLVVKGKKEHAIPYLLDEVVKEVNLAEGIIRIDWDVI